LRKLVAIVWLVLGLLLLGSLAIPLPVIIVKAIVTGSGLGLITIGIWWLRDPLFLADRNYTLLRGAVERFLALVRKLHQASWATHDAANPI
jgi:MFS superfamily sulfate permease-like transporter